MATSSSKGAHTQEEGEKPSIGSLQAVQSFEQSLILGAGARAQQVKEYCF